MKKIRLTFCGLTGGPSFSKVRARKPLWALSCEQELLNIHHKKLWIGIVDWKIFWTIMNPSFFIQCSKAFHALVKFHKRGLPGQFPGYFWPRVTFNTNLKVTRAPARNIPRLKPVICPAGARWGSCWDPLGTLGQFLKKSTQDTSPGPLRDPGGSL